MMDFTNRELPQLNELHEFMSSHVYPAEPVLTAQLAEGPLWTTPAVIQDLKKAARERGLWNLFRDLSNLDYAHIAEVSGRSPLLAPEAMNCSAPDTGNMEVLEQFGTAEQKEQWLKPLLEGEIRSAFCMTEPEVASSDAANIATSIRRDGADYVIDGRKWWSSGAMDPRCEIFIVMGKTDPDGPRHRQQSMVMVPRDAPGVRIRRGMRVFGYSDGSHGGHAEIEFDGVRVPVSNLIGAEGDGFAIAQGRLGPGRVHHCMRLIGMAERAHELMCRRALDRVAFGSPLAGHGLVAGWIAEARVRIEQARLLVLKTAWLMDKVGNKGAHTEIQAIKIATPTMAEWVLDKAIQTHGGAGVSQDFPLAQMWAAARTLRIADGPDEVHLISLARRELDRYRA
jgi:acyl-CoA dehydrogenase